MKMPENRIRKIEDIYTEKLRLTTQLKYQVKAVDKSVKILREQLKPENIIREFANRIITKRFPAFQNLWLLTAELRKYYFLKFVSDFIQKKKEK